MKNYWYMFYHTELIMRVCHVMTHIQSWWSSIHMLMMLMTNNDRIVIYYYVMTTVQHSSHVMCFITQLLTRNKPVSTSEDTDPIWHRQPGITINNLCPGTLYQSTESIKIQVVVSLSSCTRASVNRDLIIITGPQIVKKWVYKFT